MFEDLELPWRECMELAWEACCEGSVPVGAVIVHRPSGCVLSRGRNRTAGSSAPWPQISGGFMAHAEINALLGFDDKTVTPRECDLYTVLEPCPMCVGAIYMSSIRSVRYACRDGWAGAIDVLGTTPYMSRKPFTVVGPDDPDLESVIAGLQVETRLAAGRSPGTPFAESLRRTVPEGTALGEHLHRTGLVRSMLASGAGAAVAVNAVWHALENSRTG